MRQVVKWIIVCAFLAVFAQPAVHAEADDLKRIPADIVDLRLFGAWQEDGLSGVYRGIITIPRPGKTTFTLQWITLDANRSPSEVRHSLPIPEITELDGIITDYRDEIDAEGLTLYMDMQPSADAIDETFVIFVHGPGDYTFEAASN